MLLSTHSAFADALPGVDARLLALARVWAKVKFFHPYLAYKDLDWDAALLRAIPKVEAASDVAQLRAAIDAMLRTLEDPVTRTLERLDDALQPPAADWLSTPSQDVASARLIRMTGKPADAGSFREKVAKLAEAAARAKVLVLDLRGTSWGASSLLEQLDDLTPAIQGWPLERVVEHHGYVSQGSQSSGGYYSTFSVRGAQPPKPATAGSTAQLVFVADRETRLPGAAIALQASGRALIAAAAALEDSAVVSTVDVDVLGVTTARIRLGESLWGPPVTDIVAGAGDLDARVHAAATRLATGQLKLRAKPRKVQPLPQLRVRLDSDYADTPYPTRELRILAAIRIWAVLDTFSPYRYLIDDWDGAFRAALPQLIAAQDAEAYRKALRVFAARVRDGHVGVRWPKPEWSPEPKSGMPAVGTAAIEDTLVVTRILNEADARAAGIAIGDVVEMVDGKTFADLLNEQRPRSSASTDEGRDSVIGLYALAGDDGTLAKLTVRDAKGLIRERSLVRTRANKIANDTPPEAPHWKLLREDVGYVDLRLLLVPEIPNMFRDLAKTRALVFDMRGYPHGLFWSLTPWLNQRKAEYGAQVLRPLVTGSEGEGGEYSERFLHRIQELPKDGTVYAGKVVVMIDYRAISQAEHTCLMLEAAAGAKFVGSPTHGANGDVTAMRVPGGLRLWFTGQEMRHLDGRQLQRVGVQPDLWVRPTIAGVRAGRDEVLEQALKLAAAAAKPSQ